MRYDTIEPEFVEFIPKVLKPRVLYISQRYKTASHLCACGCEEKVVTPLSPVDWQLRVLNGAVSLHPSIGNWNYACKSHYWIRSNRISWSYAMTELQIARVQAQDRADKSQYIVESNMEKRRLLTSARQAAPSTKTVVQRLVQKIRRVFQKYY